MAFEFSFRPKLFDALKNYSAHNFYSDLGAGVTVGIVALPLSMALAIASGLPPQIGLFAPSSPAFASLRLAARACKSADPPAPLCRCSRQLS